MPQQNYEIEFGTDGSDHLVAVRPPVENAFRERVYDILDKMGLAREIAVRGGAFFETKHLPNGDLYSELRVDSTALTMAEPRQNIRRLAETSKEVLEEQGHTASVSRYLVPSGGTRHFFDRSPTPDDLGRDQRDQAQTHGE